MKTALPMPKPTNKLTVINKPSIKQKQGQIANNSNKQTKKSEALFLLCFWPCLMCG